MESQGAPRLHLLRHPLLACDVSPGAAAGRSAAVGPPSVRQLCAWGRGRARRCGRPVAVQKPGGSHGYPGSLPPTGGRGKGTGQMPVVTFGCALCGVRCVVAVGLEEVLCGQKVLAAGWLVGLPARSGPASSSSSSSSAHLPRRKTIRSAHAPPPRPTPAPQQQKLAGVESSRSRCVGESWGGEESVGAGEFHEGGKRCGVWGGVRGSGHVCIHAGCKRRGCQEWDSNPRLQGRLRPERSALDRSAILTAGVRSTSLASQASGAHARAQ